MEKITYEGRRVKIVRKLAGSLVLIEYIPESDYKLAGYEGQRIKVRSYFLKRENANS